MRLEGIIRLQAETGKAKDEYLTSVLSEEAARSATLDLIRKGSFLSVMQRPGSLKGTASQVASEVEAHIWNVAKRIGLASEWAEGQKLIGETKAKEREHVTQALTRILRPSVGLDD